MSVVTPGPSRAPRSVVDLIGNTPLIRLSSFEAGLRNVELYAKAEWRNPGGSVKDRPAARMIADGERSGALTRDKILLDATSGNTGIAYAMIGAARGYRVRLCVPENVTPERKRILQAFGAEVVFTDPMEGSDGAIITRARRCTRTSPDLYFYPDQYNNPGNWRAHYDTTGAGDHRADGRPSHALRRRPRHERHLRRRRPAAARVQPGDPADLGAARFAAARPRRAEAHGRRRSCRASTIPALADEDHRRRHRGGVRADAAAGAAGRPVRRDLERREPRGRAARRPRGRRTRWSWWSSATAARSICPSASGTRRRREARSTADGAARSKPGVAEAIRRHGVETYPERVLRRARSAATAWSRRTFALPNTTEEGPRRRFLVRPQDYREAERRARRARRRAARASIIRIPTIRRGRRSTISITRGRSFRTSSFPSAPASPRT